MGSTLALTDEYNWAVHMWRQCGLSVKLLWLLVMAALWNRAGHYIFALWFLSFFFSSPNLSGCRVGCLPYFHTLCGLSANLECRSEMCCTRLAGNTGRNKSPFWHRRTTLSGHILGTKACIDNRKKNLLNSNTSSTCPANMVNFGLLRAEICSRVSGTPEISTGFESWQHYCMALK